MRFRECSVGMRVECVRPFGDYSELIGEIGTIVDLIEPHVGVEFDNAFDGGHSCRGKAMDGCGRFGRAESLRPYQELPVAIELDFESAMGI